MARSMHRRSFAARLLTSYVLLVVLVSFAGIGYAVPQTADTGAAGSEESSATVPAEPPADAAPEAEPPADEAPAEEPPAEAPPPAEQPAKEPVAAAPSRDGALAPKPAGAPATTDAIAGGSIPTIGKGGYDKAAAKWDSGNLGKAWREGDWVPLRMTVANTGPHAEEYTFPQFAIVLDHYDDGPNAVFYDATRYWSVKYTTVAPSTSDPSGIPAGSTPISSIGGDEPYPSGAYGSSPQIARTFSGGTVVIPAGQYAVVYFQAHLAISAWWLQQTPAKWGAGPYSPGSPSHSWIDIDGVGKKDLPCPAVDLPGADISGFKYEDLDEDQEFDDGVEPKLPGWTFRLTGGPDGWPLNLTDVTDSNGEFEFRYLPPGVYSLTEDLQAGWLHSTPLPIFATITDGVGPDPIGVGNMRERATKTFELYLDNAPAGATFFARYWVGGQSFDVDLTGGDPYSGSAELLLGTVIESIDWYAHYDGEDLLLGTTDYGPDGETIDEDMTNAFEYESSVSGRKWNDLDAEGDKDAGEPWLSGWTIELYRVGTLTPYASDVTDGDGAYGFTDVLPGEYYVTERLDLMPGWFPTHTPAGTFSVAHGQSVTGLDFGNVEVLSGIDVEKTGETVALVGDTIQYHIVVTNTGHTPLFNVNVVDPMFGGTIDVIPVLAAGGVANYYPTHEVEEADGDLIENTVTATGTDLFGDPQSDMDSWEVRVIHPSLMVEKWVWPTDIIAGETVTYGYRITNTGDATLFDVSLDDDQIGAISLPDTELDPGEYVEVAVDEQISADTTNVATATGTDELGNERSDTDDAFVDVHAPSVQIVKTVMPTVALEGDPVTYEFVVTNTGDTPIWGMTVYDTVYGVIGGIVYLDPGASDTLYFPTTAAADDVYDIGTVQGFYGYPGMPFYGEVFDEDDALLHVIHPNIDLEKSVSADTVLAGRTVTYTYVITNTGDVPLSGVTLDDDQLGAISLPDTELDPGESVTVDVDEVLTADTTNVATATGTDPYEGEWSDTDEETVDVLAPSIDVDKWAGTDHVYFGDTVYYSYRVTNTGDATLYDVVVTDDVIGIIGHIDELAPGEWVDFLDVPWFVDDDTTNIATVLGYDELENPWSDQDTWDVSVFNPAVDIEKTVDPTVAVEGEMLTYRFVMTNTGDITLYDLVFEDPTLGLYDTNASLDPGEQWVITHNVAATTDTVNLATVTGYYEWVEGEYAFSVSDEDTAEVDVVRPSVAIYKTPSPPVLVDSGDVTYSYEVWNTGDVTLYDLEVVDDVLGPIGTIDELAPGAFDTLTMDALGITESVGNVVEVTGHDEWQHPVSASDEAWVQVIHPSISLDKVADPTVILSGADVTYTYTITNTGDVTLYDATLEDDHLGSITLSNTVFDPGETLVVVTTVPIAEDTSNIATVTATYSWCVFNDVPEGLEQTEPYYGCVTGQVWDTDDAVVDVVAPAIELVKTGSTASVLDPGEDVTYTYRVTNVGDVTLFDLEVVDDQLGLVGTASMLSVGETVTFESTAFISADTTNTAVATAVDEWEHEVSDTDDWFVLFEPFAPILPPDIALDKSADKTEADPGDIVTYTLTWENVGEGPVGADEELVITDDYDQRYMTVVDAGGGTVADGTIKWVITGEEILPGDSGSIVYKLKIADEMPEGTTHLDNVAVARTPEDENPDNDRDTWRVSVGEPFLPFTGSDLPRLLAIFALALMAGVALRRFGRGVS